MDNRKKALTGSGWSEGTGRRFRQEPEVGKLAGNQEPAGFGMTGRTGVQVQVGAGSKGINFRILLPLPTFVQVLPKSFQSAQALAISCSLPVRQNSFKLVIFQVLAFA